MLHNITIANNQFVNFWTYFFLIKEKKHSGIRFIYFFSHKNGLKLLWGKKVFFSKTNKRNLCKDIPDEQAPSLDQ